MSEQSEPPESAAERTAGIELGRCPACRHIIDPGARYCGWCGAALAGAVDTESFAVTGDSGPLPEIDPSLKGGIAAGDGVLVVLRGPDQGTRFPLDLPVITVGRAPDSAIFLDDVTVSRRHAEFERTDAGWLITDVGSLNGSYVNRQRIESQVLAQGDEVQIGKYRFLFYMAPAA